MKPLPLQEAHVTRGAVFGEVAGWEVPRHYGDPIEEHTAVRERVGIADLSHRGTLRVTGEDRVAWLQGLISNDLLPLPSGRGLYASLLSHKGKMLSYFRVYALTDALIVEDVGEIGETTYQALRKFLLYGTKAKMEHLTQSWGLLLVSGPRAASLVQQAFNCDVSTLPVLAFVTLEIGGQPALLLRTEETGETDIEVLIPAPGLSTAWERLWSAGAPLGLQAFGTEAREALRLEAGLPSAGRDLTEDITPPEANLEGKAFSLTKGCYPGQEVVARMDTYGSVRRRLVTLVLQDPVLPSRGAKILSGEREVGWVTSAAHSPSFGCSIALAFPLRDFAAPGTQLTVDIEGQRYDATVRPVPLYTST